MHPQHKNELKICKKVSHGSPKKYIFISSYRFVKSIENDLNGNDDCSGIFILVSSNQQKPIIKTTKGLSFDPKALEQSIDFFSTKYVRALKKKN